MARRGCLLAVDRRIEPMVNATVTDDLRYPVGRFVFDGDIGAEARDQRISQIAAAPTDLRSAVSGLSPTQLDTPYRPGGWTVRQVVHHVPDSHLNAYTRIKLALTEDEPTIKPYEEARWAELPDGCDGPIEPSLALLDALHQRWVLLLRSLRPDDFRRRFRHPEQGRLIDLDEIIAMYAWHGRHHVAHITSLRRRLGWG
jgi:DinB superfamily